MITGFVFVDDIDIINAAPSVNTTGEDLQKNNSMWSIRGKAHYEQQEDLCDQISSIGI